jgi:hypothetical protein
MRYRRVYFNLVGAASKGSATPGAVIPEQAGIHFPRAWIPAFAGMTGQ